MNTRTWRATSKMYGAPVSNIWSGEGKVTHASNSIIADAAKGLTTLNKLKSRQVYTNDGIITQNIFNAAVSTSVKLKTNTKKLYFCEYLIST